MDLVANLEKILYQYQTAPPVQDLRIQGWRFAVSETSQVKAGIRNNRLGDVYAAPSLTGNYAGDLLIIWPGDYCSQVVVNNKIISNLEQMLPIWKQGAFYDPEGSALLDPAPLPLVAVEHLPVRQAVTEDPKPCFEILARYRDELPTWQVNTIQAGVQAGWGLRHIRTSRGFSVTYAQTNFSTFVSADGLFGKGFAKRRLPTEAEMGRLIKETGETTCLLKREGSLQPGRQPVIFAPQLAAEFIAKFLLPNFSGNSVINKQSAYTLTDFATQRQVFDPRISLEINPLRLFELSSYLCTREGLPARAEALVSKGKMLTPYLTLKDSIKAGLKPTPLPQAGGLFLNVQGDFNRLITTTESGILVYSVLGMHTQESVTGNYSLAAPYCLIIKDGNITGRAKAVISGNFLEHLMDPATEYGNVPEENTPGLKITTMVGAA